jgi:hypothetical protein
MMPQVEVNRLCSTGNQSTSGLYTLILDTDSVAYASSSQNAVPAGSVQFFSY